MSGGRFIATGGNGGGARQKKKLKMNSIKYNGGRARCPKCKGMLTYDARMRQRLPVGFGFAPGSARFQVDFVEQVGFRGECMDCGGQVFAVKSVRHGKRFPSSVNRKLGAACR